MMVSEYQQAISVAENYGEVFNYVGDMANFLAEIKNPLIFNISCNVNAWHSKSSN